MRLFASSSVRPLVDVVNARYESSIVRSTKSAVALVVIEHCAYPIFYANVAVTCQILVRVRTDRNGLKGRKSVRTTRPDDSQYEEDFGEE